MANPTKSIKSSSSNGSASTGSDNSINKNWTLSSETVEVLARNLFDVNFKYTWKIPAYLKHVDMAQDIDSPQFEFYVNGIHTKWSMSLRFWTDEHGSRLSNPVVLCLNLISYHCDEEHEEIEIRHQFGIWNSIVKQFEVCPFTKQKIELKKPEEGNNGILSIGYRDVIILDRHLTGGTVDLYCKIVMLRSKVEQHTLALDLWDKFKAAELCDITLRSSEGEKFQAHKTILSSRSPVLAEMIARGDSILNFQMPSSILKSFLEYIYTDHVDPLDCPQGLLKIACKYELPGLKKICETALIDSITPLNVASVLLLADTFDCEQLKKAGLAYCEENSGYIVKTLAWKVMENLNPELFDAACQLN